MVLIVGEDILIFRRMNPRVLFALEVILSIWVFHFRSDVMVTPRYFAFVAVSRVWLCRTYLFMMGFLLRVIGITWHLSGWNSIFHFCSHSPSFFKSSWRMLVLDGGFNAR